MPINKFTTLLDLSRQAKILTGETATFDGKIEVGIPFSGYPTGVDTGTTVSLGIVSIQDAVFSGNSGTTVFDVSNTGSTNYDAIFSGYSATTWSNPLFSGNTSGLTLPITPLSADTQIVGPFWYLTQTGMTGDYVIGTQYTGYSITYSFFNVEGYNTGTTFSGFTTATQENFSAGTLDYKGPLDYISSVEDATVDGRLTTNKLTVTNGASASTIGYVLTQLDETGKAGWVFNSASATTNTFVIAGTFNDTTNTLSLLRNDGNFVNITGVTDTFTGNTSGDCINDIFVKNIHSCSPLNINPNDEGDVFIGSNSGFTYDLTNSSQLIKGDVVGQSDSLSLSTLISQAQSSGVKGSIKYFSHTGTTIDNIFNPNVSGSSKMQIGTNIGAMEDIEISYYGSSYVRGGTPTTGVDFWQNKAVIKTAQNSNGLVNANVSTKPTYWENQENCRMILTSDGNLGVGLNPDGTELPTEKFQIGGTGTTGNANIYGNVDIFGDPAILELNDVSNLKSQLLQNSYGALTFNINATGDTDSFIVNNAPSGNTIFRCGNNGSDVDDVMVLYSSGNTTSNPLLIFSGDSEPLVFSTGNLEVFGNIGIKQIGSVGGGVPIYIDPNGKLSDAVSDERLKENILPLNNSLNILLQLSGVSYNWINREDSGNDRFYGFIAQQLEKVDNHLTFTNKSSGYMGVRNDAITPLIVESIKEIYNNPSIPNYTPTSSNDTYGNVGNITTDDDYLYIKTNNGWKRTSLQSF